MRRYGTTSLTGVKLPQLDFFTGVAITSPSWTSMTYAHHSHTTAWASPPPTPTTARHSTVQETYHSSGGCHRPTPDRPACSSGPVASLRERSTVPSSGQRNMWDSPKHIPSGYRRG